MALQANSYSTEDLALKLSLHPFYDAQGERKTLETPVQEILFLFKN